MADDKRDLRSRYYAKRLPAVTPEYTKRALPRTFEDFSEPEREILSEEDPSNKRLEDDLLSFQEDRRVAKELALRALQEKSRKAAPVDPNMPPLLPPIVSLVQRTEGDRLSIPIRGSEVPAFADVPPTRSRSLKNVLWQVKNPATWGMNSDELAELLAFGKEK